MGRLEIVAVRHLFDLLRCQAREKFAREHAEERVAQAVDSLEMFEEQNEPLEMRGFQFAVDAVERMRHRMRDGLLLQIFLQLENIVAHRHDLRVLRL